MIGNKTEKFTNSHGFHPLVSIIIPVYNGANYLKDAIDSALTQTYGNVEVIIVNDGSKDNTEEISKSYGNKIGYFFKKNGGVSSALNLGLREMKGEYFSWLSHDDLYFPNKIEKQVEFLSKLEDKNVFLYSDYEFIDENSKKIKTMKLDHATLIKKPEYSLFRGCINGNTLLIPRRAFDEHGFFDENLKCTQDYAKWFEMMKTYSFIHMPMILAKYRMHQMQDSNKNPNAAIEGDALWIRIMRELPLEKKERLEGSESDFYKKMVFFLKQTPYRKATESANKKANEIRLKNNKPEVDYSKVWHFPEKSALKEMIRFALFSPIKFLKKYLG